MSQGEVHAAGGWKGFRKECEEAYRACLQGETGRLRDHNLVKDGEIELEFALGLAGIAAIEAGSRALDVGCGGGYLAHCLYQHGYDVTGIEISEAALAVARRQFPHLRLVLGDGAEPRRHLEGAEFDLIYIREFHPFTRIDDYPYQIRILTDYLNMLRPRGWLVLAHARREAYFDYHRLAGELKERRIRTVGPVFMFLNKHLGISARHRVATRALSALSGALASVTRQRWIEFLLLQIEP